MIIPDEVTEWSWTMDHETLDLVCDACGRTICPMGYGASSPDTVRGIANEISGHIAERHS